MGLSGCHLAALPLKSPLYGAPTALRTQSLSFWHRAARTLGTPVLDFPYRKGLYHRMYRRHKQGSNA